MASVGSSESGLRDRQKSRRRRKIISAARMLFETEGYDATTMTRIAQAAEVSPPTVFNYFGSKDALIVDLVLEGHYAARAAILAWEPPPGLTLGEMLGELMCAYLKLTMDIAGKRVWRYAEATSIRRPGTDVVRLYDDIEANHVSEIARFIQRYAPPDDRATASKATLLAKLVYHHWDALFHVFLRTENRSIATQMELVRRDMKALDQIISLTG